MAPKIDCDKSGMVRPGLPSAMCLSLSGPTPWTLELYFKISAKWISAHLSIGSGQTRECFGAPALSSSSLIPGVLAGLVSLVLFHQQPSRTYCPGCHPPVEAAIVCPYSCSGARKWPWRSKADGYWELSLYSPYNRGSSSLRTALQPQSKCPVGAESSVHGE